MSLVTSIPASRANEAAGRWRGTWTTHTDGSHRGHHGTLRVRLKPKGDGTLQGVFAGRFAVVVPYFYRATVNQYGNTLQATKRLGPFGSYNMTLFRQPGALTGNWSAGGQTGSIRLKAF